MSFSDWFNKKFGKKTLDDGTVVEPLGPMTPDPTTPLGDTNEVHDEPDPHNDPSFQRID